MRWQSVVEEWLADRRIAKLSPRTVKAYRADLGQIGRRLADGAGVPVDVLEVGQVTGPALRAAFADLADGHSAASVARCLSTWRSWCRFAVAEGHLPSDPTAVLPSVRVGKRLPAAFTESATERILRVVQSGGVPARDPWPERDYAVMATLLLSGVRASELIGLDVGDVVSGGSGAFLQVRGGKGGKDRAVPVQEELLLVVDAYRDSLPGRFPGWPGPQPDDPLFVSNRGVRMTQGVLEYLVERVYRAAGVAGERPAGAMVHATRHTWGTRLVQSGASAVDVMVLLGHSTLQSSQRYLDAKPAHLRAAAAGNPAYRLLDGPGTDGG